MRNKIVIGGVILALTVFGAAQILWLGLDAIVKRAIIHVTEDATQTPVDLRSVKIDLKQGTGILKGFSIANPKGFSKQTAVYLDAAALTIDHDSVLGDGPIIINEINIEGPKITYEFTQSGNSNLEALKDSAEKNTSTPATKGDREGRKIIIKDLYLKNGEIEIYHPLLKEQNITLKMPVLHLKNVGGESGGASPAQITEDIISHVAASAGGMGDTALNKQIGVFKNMLYKGKNEVEELGNTVKGFFKK